MRMVKAFLTICAAAALVSQTATAKAPTLPLDQAQRVALRWALHVQGPAKNVWATDCVASRHHVAGQAVCSTHFENGAQTWAVPVVVRKAKRGYIVRPEQPALIDVPPWHTR